MTVSALADACELSAVVPGDQLILEVEVLRIARGVGKFATRAKVGDEIAAEAELMAALRPANTGGCSVDKP